MKHIVSFSGGKDSTAMLLMMLEKGMPVDEVVFIDTGMEFPEMYEHIAAVEAYTGLSVTRLKSERTWDYLFSEHKRTRGPYAGQRGYGWPSMLRRWCTRSLKQEPVRKWLRQFGGDFVQYIGIAADEPKRVKHDPKFKERYPLVDWGITERQALEYCYAHGFRWGGLYELTPRVSCYLCPMQSIGSWRNLRKHRPELWARALEYDSKSSYQLNTRWSLHDLEERFKREGEELNLNC